MKKIEIWILINTVIFKKVVFNVNIFIDNRLSCYACDLK